MSDKSEATAKKQTGFTKPLSLSNDLAAVLGTMEGEKRSRAQVRPIDHNTQGQIFILETAILATPYFQTFYYDGCTAGQKVKSGES